MNMENSVYKTEARRDQFRAHYNRILSRFPFEQRYIKTAFGQTFILTAGQQTNPPIILLHGSCSNSAFWVPEMVALSDHFKVYAVDIIGEAGNSDEHRPDIGSDAFALWMKDVLDALQIDRTVLIGNSLGGWMALKFATAYPERVSRLILIAAAGLAEIRSQFLVDVGQAKQEDGIVPVSADIIGAQNIPKEVLEFMNMIVESYDPIAYLPVYTDEQLKRLNMPVLFIDGEDDAIIDAEKSAQRLSRLVGSAVVHLLANCGHVVTNSSEHIIAFLAATYK